MIKRPDSSVKEGIKAGRLEEENTVNIHDRAPLFLLLLLLFQSVTNSPQDHPSIEVSPLEVDLGILDDHTIRKCTFRIENKGNADLHVQRVEGDQGLSVPPRFQTALTIEPGGAEEMEVVFYTWNLTFAQKRNLRIVSDDPLTPTVTVTIRAYIRKDYKIDPPFLLFKGLLTEEEACRTVRVRNLMEGPLRLSKVAPSLPFIKVACRPEKDGKDLFLDITVDPSAVPSDKAKVAGWVRFKTNSTFNPEGKVLVVVEPSRGWFLQPRLSFISLQDWSVLHGVF